MVEGVKIFFKRIIKFFLNIFFWRTHDLDFYKYLKNQQFFPRTTQFIKYSNNFSSFILRFFVNKLRCKISRVYALCLHPIFSGIATTLGFFSPKNKVKLRRNWLILKKCVQEANTKTTIASYLLIERLLPVFVWVCVCACGVRIRDEWQKRKTKQGDQQPPFHFGTFFNRRKIPKKKRSNKILPYCTHKP